MGARTKRIINQRRKLPQHNLTKDIMGFCSARVPKLLSGGGWRGGWGVCVGDGGWGKGKLCCVLELTQTKRH